MINKVERKTSISDTQNDDTITENLKTDHYILTKNDIFIYIKAHTKQYYLQFGIYYSLFLLMFLP